MAQDNEHIADGGGDGGFVNRVQTSSLFTEDELLGIGITTSPDEAEELGAFQENAIDEVVATEAIEKVG